MVSVPKPSSLVSVSSKTLQKVGNSGNERKHSIVSVTVTLGLVIEPTLCKNSLDSFYLCGDLPELLLVESAALWGTDPYRI